MNDVGMSTSYIIKISFHHEICKSRSLSLTLIIAASHHNRVGKYIDALTTTRLPGNILRVDSCAGSFHGPDRS